MRPGTHNTAAIVGLGAALRKIKRSNLKSENQRLQRLRDYLIRRVLQEIPKSFLNGSRNKRAPNNVNFRFDDVEGEGIILSLDIQCIAASTGSACSSGSLQPSHVLLALGLRPEQAHGSLRLTLGRQTNKQEIDAVIKALKKTIERLRKISGNVLDEFI